jgi:putative phosphoribosyl transferase
MFLNREDGARQLALRLKPRELRDPVVLAIPRGGVVTGAILADGLDAELDVVLARKLRAPFQPELAIGAISETGEVYLNNYAKEVPGVDEEYLQKEQQNQLEQIAHRKELFRKVRPPVDIANRSVIVTDDGIATGSTMIAALQSVRLQNPHELLVAVPVAPPDRLIGLRDKCDEVICLLSPPVFFSIGQFYKDFSTVEDPQAVELLRHAYRRKQAAMALAAE